MEMPYTNEEQERLWAEQLLKSRLELQREMQRALFCMDGDEKRALAKEWKEKYSLEKFEELIRFAKNKKAMRAVANWNLEDFRQHRVKEYA
jgi:hypothetical protein